jgi:Family of unknown function (DUF6502)
VRSQIQDVLLSALENILRPIVKLLLQSGIGYSEFASVAKSVFVRVATDDYKRRGRPANFSQVSAMTGISRKEVSRMRKGESEGRWTPNMEASPVNTILHEWHFDPDFSDGAGTAKTLPFDGPLSFSTLVSRYARDIPPGAMRATLQKAGVLLHDADCRISVTQPYFYSKTYDEDFIRGAAFSLGNLGSTLAYNARIRQDAELTIEKKSELTRLERGVWSEHLSKEGAARFKAWVDATAPRLLEEANRLIGENELPQHQWATETPRAVGMNIFYYEEG